jgi:hypothetical protein
MDKATGFLILCIEEYKVIKNMTGAQVVSLFDTYGAIKFILDCHETLHVESPRAIAWQIDDFIAHHAREK